MKDFTEILKRIKKLEERSAKTDSQILKLQGMNESMKLSGVTPPKAIESVLIMLQDSRVKIQVAIEQLKERIRN